MPASPARRAASEILLRMERTDAYASELLHALRYTKLSLADHGLLTELVMGVLRWRSVLDQTIARYSSQSFGKLDSEVLISLRLGAYQLIFLDRVPPRAAIHDSVELVKSARKRSAAGFVNAVLRKISDPPPKRAEMSPLAAHPNWLVERWKKNYQADVTGEICDYDQTAPSPVLRISPPNLLKELKQEGVHLAPGKLVGHAYRASGSEIFSTTAFRGKRVVFQDEASQLVALLVGRGENMLDCCAAPGGKTRILAERNPGASVMAVELHPHRAGLLNKLVSQSNVRVIAGDLRMLPFKEPFDRILVDAPCSGTGTLARNPEIKWRLQPEDLARFQTLQIELLTAAMKQVAPGGQLTYSTCSLEPEENQQVIEKALVNDASFAVIDCRGVLQSLQRSGDLVWRDLELLVRGPYLRTVPGLHPCDGFFAAILQKR
jgi:16S rRNA (cytosine967-C5)-methyltransferase